MSGKNEPFLFHDDAGIYMDVRLKAKRELELIRLLTTPEFCSEIRERLMKLLVREVVEGRLTMVEAVFIKTLYDFGVKRIFP